MIVVLNDNEMSISANVGGMSAHLSKIMTGQVMLKFKQEVKQLLLAVPGVGKEITRYAHKIDEAIKGVFIPGRLFEDLGFRYVGPIDGHDVDALIETFSAVKDLKGPTLMHVITRKGKGYEQAEEKADIWHGAKPFDISTGEFHKKKSNPAYTNVFADAMIQLAKEDEKLIGITAAMPDGTGISKFGKEFPDRTFDVGMAEQHGVAFAGALSIEGFRPVVAIYSTFLQRAYDQVVHDICLMDLSVTFAMDRAGIVGEDGATHQGLYDIAFLRTLPNMVVMAPKDENELRHMLKTAVYHQGPAALRYPRGSGLGVPLDPELKELEIGKGEVIQDGTDIAIFAYGHTVDWAQTVADKFEKEGVSVAVINARFAKPVDKELIVKYALKARCLITTEEHSLKGGFGSAILEALQEEQVVNIPVKCIGLEDIVLEHGSPSVQRKDLKLDPEGMFETIMTFYGAVAEMAASGNGNKWVVGNGKKSHSPNGKKPAYSGNGNEEKIKVKEPLNG
jgi:1-deoxy-D-xylulose-5-phosphate synthase